MDFQFVEATREQLKLRMAITGITGGGKTYTALALATYMLAGDASPSLTSRIAVIDSERGSSRRYSKGKPFYFSVLELTSFSPETYVEAMKTAARAGFEFLIIDSLTHEWAGTDGALEQKDRAGGTFASWAKITPRHNAVIDTIMASPLHVIGTMRSKMAHEQTEDERGKKTVKKLGLQPIQRDGIEYEFDIVGDMNDGAMNITKTRCIEISNKQFLRPGRDLAKIVMGWLADGEAPTAKATPPMSAPEIAAASRAVVQAATPEPMSIDLALKFQAHADRIEGCLTVEQCVALRGEMTANLPPGDDRTKLIARLKAWKDHLDEANAAPHAASETAA